MDFDFQKIGVWLDLTDQQFQILSAIHQLELRKERPSPQNIVREYRVLSNKLIQKPNLFTIIKVLSDRRLLKKLEQGTYAIDFDGLRDVLAEKKEEKQMELDHLGGVIDKTEEYFVRYLKPREHPEVTYLGHDALFAKLAKSVRDAKVFSVVSNFPSIAYTYSLYAKLNEEAYVQAMLERAVKSHAVRFNFLTDLDVDHLFNHAFATFGDPTKAYRECKLVLTQLENMIADSDCLDVRFHEDPHGLDVAIPERKEDEPTEFIIFTRDEHRNIMGGVHVKVSEPAKQAKYMFKKLFDYGERLSGKQAGKRLQERGERLDRKYGVLGK